MAETPGEVGLPFDEETPARRVKRPWEDDDKEPVAAEEDDEVESEDSPDEEGGDEDASPLNADEDVVDEVEEETADELWARFTEGSYLAATTQEYRGLAEDVAKAGTETHQAQAVAAHIPGVGSGLIGFEDVTGERGISEADVEHAEQARTSDLALRVATGLVLLTLFMGSLVLGGIWFTGFIGLVMVLAVGEFYATIRTRRYSPLALFGLLGVIGAAVAANVSGPGAIGGALVFASLAICVFFALANRRRPLENAAFSVLGMLWVGVLSFAILIADSSRAVQLVMGLVVMTAMFDTGSYFVGRSMGRRKLAPVLSPQKTREGLIGGIVTVFVVGVLLAGIPLFDPLDLNGVLYIAAMICLLAPLGDLAESMVKRSLGVKDMGSILPGHGGMLDRIDSFILVVPAAYFLFDALNYL